MGRLVQALDRIGHVTQQPPVWAAAAGLLAVAGGRRGRAAAARGSVCYAVAAVVGNLLIKPIVKRDRPPEAGEGRIGPVTSSFPSGHAATDLAFAFGAAQEIPAVFLPLAFATSTAHWSLVRGRGHYASDVLLGGALGIAVAAVLWKLWPPRRKQEAGAADPDAR